MGIHLTPGIVQSLLSFSRPERLENRTLHLLELADVVDEAVRLVKLSRSGRDITFDSRVPAGLAIEGDRSRMTQAKGSIGRPRKASAQASPSASQALS